MKFTKTLQVRPYMQSQYESTALGTSLLFSLSIALLLTATRASAAVSVENLPEPGLQPQTVTASDGTVHLVYLVGDPKAADIHYRRRTIRGAQLALGRNGRVHVCWNGSRAESMAANGGAPMLYSRLNDDGKSFAPEKNLMRATHELDGGG